MLAFDQYSGVFAFSRPVAASNAAYLSPICGAALSGALMSYGGVVQGNASVLVIPMYNPCLYVVLEDFTVVGVEVTVNGVQATSVSQGDFFVLTTQQVLRLRGATGQLAWQQDLYGPLQVQQSDLDGQPQPRVRCLLVWCGLLRCCYGR
jgi:hypothetical protein